MPGCCCSSVCTTNQVSPRFRKALWIALLINAVMFVVEVIGGMTSGSVSLWADALDFAGDAGNYAISLAVLSMGIAWRSRAAMTKGLTMAAFGVFVLVKTAWAFTHGVPPEPLTMSIIGVIALIANGSVALLLYTFRDGDANMRSVWLCSRNDAIGNIAVMIAAAGVFGTGSGLPDILVGVVMAGMALSSGMSVVRQARQEMSATKATAHVEASAS